jgi:hypothetical protein
MDDLMYSKFLYTAITRSENKLLVIGYDWAQKIYIENTLSNTTNYN